MTNIHLVLHDVSYALPDGRVLFSGLNEQFDTRPTGLVGRNGVGKTLLARILAGLLPPTSGHCRRSGSAHYLAQQVVHPDDATVATLAGVKHTLDALARIESGSTAVEDFDAVGDDWDLPSRLHLALEQSGLSHLDADTPASVLSGGEAMRVSLAGAMLSNADFLILDEPSNHLDRPNRQALIEQLQRWPRGLIVVSHDRQLLDAMQRIVELSSLGLQSYGGNYTFYAEARAHERQNAQETLAERKRERQREVRAMRKQVERQERRQARGYRQGKEANQAKVLLDGQKERSEASSGALRRQQSARLDQLNQDVKEAAQQVEKEAPIALHDLPVAQPAKRRVAELDGVELPFVAPATRSISLILSGQQRLGVIGPNGCGKSTLLRVMAGRVAPLAGVCEVTSRCAYLDQQLENLDPQVTVLEQLRSANSTATEADLRMRLAQLGLDARKIATPSGSLSGGERLKAALACLLYADMPPPLLLLDEPNNHLDLPSAQALETMLCSYRGALVVVSHDDVFLGNLDLTGRLLATEQGWSLAPL
ncbi:ABC-F family ATP-binding cassette domain-containing protein [Aquisalimonas asiatica]|uniref:ATPase components of ABC transporters with duplicated ATPase domains n=1 Tax=Aquisalimonas asiatica TaxID=406100 RepID=A0A1H8QF47_9GAMM|nr:ABC-F family ATP-binding cassette domain-containing protein [Aquisalimonas asiatica]SEO52676.1 ATPase components of ABC transporters with duplicated ATPase domains [Aquisalimonas asiatica]